MKLLILLSFVLLGTSVRSEGNKTYQLELVQALFRHGDRIPDKSEVYGTDPYDPEHYAPTGYGQLTNAGMQRGYKLGRLLRKLYKNFLGEYRSEKVYAYSTDYDRTKATLQLVLAGLFPPAKKAGWNKRLRWIPVPTHYRPLNSDFLRSSIAGSCGGFAKMQQLVDSVPEVQERMAKYNDFLGYVQNKTEIKDTRMPSVTLLMNNLFATRSMNLPLPWWCSEQEFKMLEEIMSFIYKSLSITPELRKQIAGPMIKQFLDNMNNHTGADERKIYLYSGHDLNVAPYLGAHNFTGIPAIPDFGSTVIIEKLRGSDNESYVRMLMWTGTGGKMIKLKLENCDYECPLSTYEKIAAPMLPDQQLVDCISGNVHCYQGLHSKATTPRSELYWRLIAMMYLLLNVARNYKGYQY